jgi:hypothetical protein
VKFGEYKDTPKNKTIRVEQDVDEELITINAENKFGF